MDKEYRDNNRGFEAAWVIDERPAEPISEEYYQTIEEKAAREHALSEKRRELVEDQSSFGKTDFSTYAPKLSKAGLAAAVVGTQLGKQVSKAFREAEEFIIKNGLTQNDVARANELSATTTMDFMTALHRVDIKKREQQKEVVKFAKEFGLEKKEIPEECKYTNVYTKEIDYTQLKPGMRVRIKTWDRMVEEYGVYRSYINTPGSMYFVCNDKHLCGKVVTIKNNDEDSFEIQGDIINCALTYYCIAEIITDKEEAKRTYGNECSRNEEVPKKYPLSAAITIDEKDLIYNPDLIEVKGGMVKLKNQDEADKSITYRVDMANTSHAYQKPQQVKALWLGQTEGDVEFDDFDELLDSKYEYIGHIPNDGCFEGLRFHIKKNGVRQGYAIKINTITDIQGKVGDFYLFETELALLRWMAEGEE